MELLVHWILSTGKRTSAGQGVGGGRVYFRLWELLLNCPPQGSSLLFERLKWVAEKLCHLPPDHINGKILPEFESRQVSLQTSLLSITLCYKFLKIFPLWPSDVYFLLPHPRATSKKKPHNERYLFGRQKRSGSGVGGLEFHSRVGTRRGTWQLPKTRAGAVA